MNYSSKLWLEEDDKKGLATLLQETLENHNLQNKNIFIGGFSSGGIVSMLISNYINGKREFYIDPKGVFIADSPIDLLALYKASELNIKKNCIVLYLTFVNISTTAISTKSFTFFQINIPVMHRTSYICTMY